MKPWLLTLFLSPMLSGQVLYNINFSEPTQTAGQVVRTGSGPLYPSTIRLGSPMIQASAGSLTDQPLVLDMQGNAAPYYYDQIALKLSLSQSSHLFIEFDVETHGLVGSYGLFAVSLYSSSTRAVKLFGDGSISAMNMNAAATVVTHTSIGAFVDDQAMHFEIDMDFGRDLWGVKLDGSPLGTSSLSGVKNLSEIWFTYGSIPPPYVIPPQPDQGYAAIDNIKVFMIPEPSAYTEIMGVIALLVSLCHCRRPRNRSGELKNED